MHGDPIEKLTPGQKTCLRMVLRHQTSKNIARELKISRHTVDQRLRAAMTTLGVDSRVKAAQLLAASEGPNLYQPLIYQAPHIAGPAGIPAALTHGTTGTGQAGSSIHSGMREEQAHFNVAAEEWSADPQLSFPPLGRTRNDLSVWQKLGWIFAIAIGSSLAFGMLLAGLTALGSLFRH